MWKISDEEFTRRRGPSKGCLPPLAQMRRRPHHPEHESAAAPNFFLESYLKYGPVFRFRRSHMEFIVIAGPEANIFMSKEGKNHFRAREYRQEQNDELGIEKTLVSLDGEEHAILRKLQRRGYSRAILDGRYSELVGAVRGIIRQWRTGQRLPVRSVFPRIVAEQLGIGILNHPVSDHLDDILLFFRTLVIETVAKSRPKSVLYTPFYQMAKARTLKLADKIIATHRIEEKKDERAPDLVDDLLAALAKDPMLMSEQELRIAVLGGYIGGLDTVANTCSFMLYALLKHPDVLARVTAKVNKAFENGVPTQAILKGMEALQHSAKETLRLYPVASAIQGTVAEPFEFEGYKIEEGQNLIVATTVSHFLPNLYLDPHKFDMDRFAQPRCEHQQPGAYAPYGIGAHICLGMGIAEVLIMLTMATLLRTVRLAMSPPDYQLQIEFMPSPTPKDFYVHVVEQRQ